MFSKAIVNVSVVTALIAMPPVAIAAENDKNPAERFRPAEPNRLLKDWKFKVGSGVMYAPDYAGSDDYEANFLPVVEVHWKDRVSLSIRKGLLVDALKSEHLTFGLGVRISDNRDASENNALTGLGDIDVSAEGVLYGQYRWRFIQLGATFAQDLGGGHGGATIGLEANFSVPVIKDKLMFRAGANATWASDDYMQSFYGISTTQAASSAYSTYDAGSGFKDVGARAMAEYRFTKSISLNVIAQYTHVVGDAADSPLVKDEGSENQIFTGLTLNYSF